MFIARNDKNNNFKFVSSFSDFGIKLLLNNKIEGLEKLTIILVEKESEIYIKSVAIRKIILKLPYYKLIGYFMFIIPEKISDYLYNFISKNRKMIIKNKICEIPNFEIRKKFIT